MGKTITPKLSDAARRNQKDWQDCWYDYYLAISKTETTTKDWP